MNPKTLKLSFSTLACPDWTWRDVLRYSPQYGYDGVEIRLLARETDLLNIADLQPSQWSVRKAELSAANFAVAGLASSVRFDQMTREFRRTQMDTGRRYVDLCHALGGKFIRAFGDKLPVEPHQRSTALAWIAEGLIELADYATKFDIQILLETHGDFSASPPCEQLMRLVDHPSAGLVWDTHHPWRFHGEPLDESWSRLRPWVHHVHWKDSITIPQQSHSAESQQAARHAAQLMSGHQHADYVLFRGGEFPAIDCYRLLADAGYSGWHSLEWEKMWHPELAGPEVALPLFPIKMRELHEAVHLKV